MSIRKREATAAAIIVAGNETGHMGTRCSTTQRVFSALRHIEARGRQVAHAQQHSHIWLRLYNFCGWTFGFHQCSRTCVVCGVETATTLQSYGKHVPYTFDCLFFVQYGEAKWFRDRHMLRATTKPSCNHDHGLGYFLPIVFASQHRVSRLCSAPTPALRPQLSTPCFVPPLPPLTS